MRSVRDPLHRTAAVLLLAMAGHGNAETADADDLEALISDEGPAERAAGAEASEPLATLPVAPLRTPADVERPRIGNRVVEEIVVTAQKTEQSLQDVPISVSAVGAEQIQDAAVTEAQDLFQYTPNVKFSQGASLIPTINIRGFGSPPLGRNLEPSVGLSIDDVFYGRSTFSADGIFDIDRVEVLRGPQGTLFGKNTVAGVLNYTTAPASFEPGGFLTLAGGSQSGRRIEGAVGGGLVDDVLAARLSFRARERDIGMYNTTLDEDGDIDDLAARLKLRWHISDSLSADLNGFVARTRSTGTAFELQHASARSMTRYRQADPQTEDEPFNGRQSFNEQTFSDRDAYGAAVKLGQHVGSVGLIDEIDVNLIVAQAQVETPYRLDTDFSPIDAQSLESDGPERYRQRSFELRTTAVTPGLFGIGEQMRWIGGVFGLSSISRVSQLSTINVNGVIDIVLGGASFAGRIPATPDAVATLLGQLGLPDDISDLPGPIDVVPDALANEVSITRTDVDARTLALFLQTSWSLTERLELTLGYRYGRERKQGQQSSQCQNRPVCTALAIFAGQRNFANASSRDEIERSPKIAVSYAFSDAVTGFANVTRGFKSGGYSGPLLSPTRLEYGPESALSYEAGVKTRLLDGSLVLNAAVYHVTFDDLQVNLFDGTNISTINAASAVSRGLEIDWQWLPPLAWLSLAGSFGLSDVAYGDFVCGPAVAGDTDASPECNPDNEPQPPPTQDLSGRETPFTPRMTASFTPSLRFPVWPRLQLNGLFGLDVLYQGEQYLDTDLDPASYQAATTKLNARVGVSPANRRWSVVLNAKNLTGERERALVVDQPVISGNFVTIAVPDEPLYVVDLRYNFGD
jgi:iron complex outermembrane receptor protein